MTPQALASLNESAMYMGKAKMKDFTDQENKVSSLQSRIELVKRYSGVRKVFRG